jgi:hypothetical protein
MMIRQEIVTAAGYDTAMLVWSRTSIAGRPSILIVMWSVS